MGSYTTYINWCLPITQMIVIINKVLALNKLVWFVLKVLLILSWQLIFYTICHHKCSTSNDMNNIISVSTILLSLSSQSVQKMTTFLNMEFDWVSQILTWEDPLQLEKLVFSFIDAKTYITTLKFLHYYMRHMCRHLTDSCIDFFLPHKCLLSCGHDCGWLVSEMLVTTLKCILA